jgi:hypothetical protein
MVGRGLRLHEGKQELLLFDHGANYQRLGLAEHIHHGVLDDGQTPAPGAGSINKTHKCKNCMHVYVHRYPDPCPACGFYKAQSNIVTIPDELIRVTPLTLVEQKIDFYRGLLSYRRTLGWLRQRYRQRFGIDPHEDTDFDHTAIAIPDGYVA